MAAGWIVADDDDDSADTAVRLGNLQQACLDWSESDPERERPTRWCTAMTAWMYEEGSRGHMSGSMMWGDPDRLRDACRRWAIADPSAAGAASDAGRWCVDMTSWMQQHMGDDWDRWMMRDQTSRP